MPKIKHKQGKLISIPVKKQRGRYSPVIFLLGLVVGIMAGYFFTGQDDRTLATASALNNSIPVYSINESLTNISNVSSIEQLLALPEDELSQVDIALMNLICAQGLNGSEALDINKCLVILDDWTARIKADTQARLPAYHANPAKYDNSVNLFKLVNMILILKNNMGVDYNLDIMQSADFLDSRDFFLHGCLTGKKQGGCISIPVMCVAVGRRLGYPLKLALTREHVFFRWEDGREVFNMEACCPGCDTFPDDHYKTWPNKLSDMDVELNDYLRSLTTAEELGLFLETRAHCLYDIGHIPEALVYYARAYELMPSSLDRLANIHKVFNHQIKKFQDIRDREKKKSK